MNDYPWKIGDLVLFYESSFRSGKEQDPKSAVIIDISYDNGFKMFTVLVDGKSRNCFENQIQVPKIKKVKTNFKLKK